VSLYSALSAGVSGLNAQSSAMATVADNITNINTVGYKATETQFSTMVGEGRAGATYVAGGVKAVAHSLISKAGLTAPSSNSTDLSINGNGFFVTRTGSDATSAVSLTRAGSFVPNKQGYLVNTSGAYLQGWRLSPTGGYVNTGTMTGLESVKLSDLQGTASATTAIAMKANFPTTTTAYTGTYNAGDMASGAVTPAFTRPMDVTDAQGVSHRVNLAVIRTGVNTWKGEIYASPASEVTAGGGVLASGTIKFNADGSLDKAGSSAALFGSITPSWTNGAAASPIALNFGDNGGVNGFTSYDTPFTATPTVNGGKLGTIASIEVSTDGIVSAKFEDGTSRAVFKLPIATVPNPDGMTRTSGNGFATSSQSGDFKIVAPGEGGGTISAFSLEASTSDLGKEFTDMIRFQRAYSASSKIITTVDDMLQEVSNLKR